MCFGLDRELKRAGGRAACRLARAPPAVECGRALMEGGSGGGRADQVIHNLPQLALVSLSGRLTTGVLVVCQRQWSLIPKFPFLSKCRKTLRAHWAYKRF